MSPAEKAYQTYSNSFGIQEQNVHVGGQLRLGPVPWERLPKHEQERWRLVAFEVSLITNEHLPAMVAELQTLRSQNVELRETVKNLRTRQDERDKTP